MDANQAINILIQAVNDAQVKGAYTLPQAGSIIKAIETLTTPPQQEEVGVKSSIASKVVNEKK
jgi:hypothetical protein